MKLNKAMLERLIEEEVKKIVGKNLREDNDIDTRARFDHGPSPVPVFPTEEDEKKWAPDDIALALDFLAENALRLRNEIARRSNEESDFHPSAVGIQNWNQFQSATRKYIAALAESENQRRAKNRSSGRPMRGWSTKRRSAKAAAADRAEAGFSRGGGGVTGGGQ